MIDLNDKIWVTLEGGYRMKYDTSLPLKNLQGCDSPSKEIWDTLWEELYHQGDVGIASYAAIPHLIRIYKEKGWFDDNLCMFAATIESSRLEDKNPKIPQWLEHDYKQSLLDIVKYFIEELTKKWGHSSLIGVLMLISLLQGNHDLAELLNLIDEGQEKIFIEKMDPLAPLLGFDDDTMAYFR